MRTYDYGWGAQPSENGTIFRVWALRHETLALEIDGGPVVPLHRAGSGWFETILPVGPGARYRYRLPDGAQASDPAARKQIADVQGWSVVVDPSAYRWRHTDWRGRPWRDSVIYQVHVGILGGFRAVTELLVGWAALGITAIQLMSLADFSGRRSWGYDGVQQFAPAEAYGSCDDLKNLVDSAHGLGLSVFLDVVYNHFGPDGASIHALAPQMFRPDIQTPWGDAIDFRRPEVRAFFVENATYWLQEYYIDGLRFDAVHALHSDDFMESAASEIRSRLDPERHIHFILENEDNDSELLSSPAISAQWNDDFHNALHVLLTGETHGYYLDFADEPIAKLARALSEGFAYQGETSGNLGKPRGKPSSHLPSVSFVAFLQNHDQIGNRPQGDRLTTLADPAALRAAMLLLLLSPQIPMLFMGEEFGSQTPFHYFTDYHDELAEDVRQGRDQELAQIGILENGPTEDAAPDPNDYETFAASRPEPGPDSREWEKLVRSLLEIRHKWLMPSLERVRPIEVQVLGSHALTAQWRIEGDRELVLVVNLGPDDIETPAPRGLSLVTVPEGVDRRLLEARLPGRSAAAYLWPPHSENSPSFT